MKNSRKALVHCQGYQPLSVFTCGLMPGCILGTMTGERRGDESIVRVRIGVEKELCEYKSVKCPNFLLGHQASLSEPRSYAIACEGAMLNRTSNKKVKEKTRTQT